MGSRACRIAHVVKAIEHRNEAVIGAGKILGRGNFEADPAAEPRIFGGFACVLDRRFAVVETHEG